MKRLSGKNAVVTGAAQGIGYAIARRLSQEGARITIADTNVEKGPAAADTISVETGGAVHFVKADVSDAEDVATMTETASRKFGTVDILVNNAGVAVFCEPLEMTREDWDKCMSVDLAGAWLCCQAALPQMLEQGRGAIINIVSNHALCVLKSTFPYPVAKHGLLGLTRALALEYASRGITVNAISPGFVDTPIAEWFFAQAEDPAGARRAEEQKIPSGRLCAPSEVAAVAALLASDEARFIVGENIVIDGGVTIQMSN